ncbi:cytochrome b [Pseudomonas migulae]|jgi:cytochrome b561|uniref:cytochrome b n=1 Tax=Pseudomonas migulae TaxID=78543 RepID=UPI0037211447
MTTLGYSTQRVWLHWLSAAVIVWTLISGFYVAAIDSSPKVSRWVAFLNVSLTTVYIPFFVWRFIIFVAHARHTSVRTLGFMGKLALFAHTLIYLVISLVLVTGVLMMDRPIDVFGLVEIAQPLSDPGLIAWFLTLHVWACVFLALLIVLHVGAVIIHELCGHRVLRRMSFCSRVRSEPPE